VDEQNRDAQDYNSKLEKMLQTLQGSLRGSKIVYLNAYQAFTEILANTNKYGMFSIDVLILVVAGPMNLNIF
jgi:phospholipase/lecithinase/hemolysin